MIVTSAAWTLKQDWPIDSTVYVDDMTWDDGNDTLCTLNIPPETIFRVAGASKAL